ncbi:hypothetical protein LCGC14_0936130 [marine sediment metagenome]|uniref:Uncharacterized protein n=1 Tax=marine sediment metagenome TaxID=412755 RepID=A0A0F9NLK7_9ZZZZ|nr:hypothetical protein [Methylophaga sp.]
MCSGVYFKYGDDVLRFFYANPNAALPILTVTGKIELIAWGRRQQQSGNLPITGWAQLEAIYSGRWDKFFPTPVKIPALSFMEKDLEGHSHWYDLQKGQFIQGLLAKEGNERRVYIVTIEPELEDAQIHARWPRVVQQGEKSRQFIDN